MNDGKFSSEISINQAFANNTEYEGCKKTIKNIRIKIGPEVNIPFLILIKPEGKKIVRIIPKIVETTFAPITSPNT